MKDLALVTEYLRTLSPRDKEIVFDRKLTQDHVTGDVFYPLSGGDLIDLEVFPNAKIYFHVDEHSFESRSGSASESESDFTYFDESVFNQVFKDREDSYLQSIGMLENGYDFTDVHFMYWKADKLDIDILERWKKRGISAILLGRLRIVYKAEILSIEKIRENIYRIDFIHNQINKSLYYIAHLFDNKSAIYPEIIWLKSQANFKALLVKAIPMNGSVRLDIRKAIVEIILRDIQKSPQEFTIVSDSSMTGPCADSFNKDVYEQEGFTVLSLNTKFGYSQLALITTGQMLLDGPKSNALFFLNYIGIIIEFNNEIANGRTDLLTNSPAAKIQPIQASDFNYLDNMNIGINIGNNLLDIAKAYLVNTNYYKIQASISFTKIVSLWMKDNFLFSLASSADILATYYWDRNPKEKLNTITLKLAIGVASVALYYSPFSYAFKVLSTSVSLVNFAYKAEEMVNELLTPIRVTLCKEGKKNCLKTDLDFLQFKNLGVFLTQEHYSSHVFTSQNELDKNPLVIEYINENCKLTTDNISCGEGDHNFYIEIMGNYIFND